MTPRQRKFCKHYLESLNASDAARKAGYGPKFANRIGQRLLTNVDIKEYIAKHIDQGLDSRLPGLRNRIVNELENEAFVSGFNKLKALEILAKYSGVLRESNGIALSDNLEIHSVTTIKKKNANS